MQCEGSYSCSVLSKLIKYLRKYLTCTCLYLFWTGTKNLTQVPGTKYLIRNQVLLMQVHCTLYLGSVQGTKYRAKSTRSFVRYKSTCIVPGTAVTGTVLDTALPPDKLRIGNQFSSKIWQKFSIWKTPRNAPIYDECQTQ